MRINHTAPYNSSRFSQPLALLLVGLFLLLSPCAWGVGWTDITPEQWTRGSGTQKSPYKIEKPEHLAELSKQVNKGTSYEGVYFAQTIDFDMTGTALTPIGTKENPFKGNYTGNIIKNLSVTTANNYAALFGYVEEGTLKNIVLTGSFTCATGVKFLAGLVANADNTQIDNCHNTVTQIFAAQIAGGLVARTINNCVIDNCSNTSSVVGEKYSDFSYAGGLVAYNTGTLTIHRSYNRGAVSAKAYLTMIDDVLASVTAYAGGLVGHCSHNGSVNISCGYNVGSVTATSYREGDFSGNKYPRNSSCFGLAHNCSATNSYNAGTLSASHDVNVSPYMYGITDNANEDNVVNCYYKSDDYVFGWGEPTADGTLKSDDMPDDLDGDVYTKDTKGENSGYPIFKEQSSEGAYTITISCDPVDGIYILGLQENYAEGATATITLTPKNPCYDLPEVAYDDESGEEYSIVNNILKIAEIGSDMSLSVELSEKEPFTISVTAEPSNAGTVCITEQ